MQHLIPTERLNELARESGFIQRQRKLGAKELFWTLVLGFGTGEERTIAGLRRALIRVTGRGIARSSFYERFTPALVRFLCLVLSEVMAKSVEESRGRLQGALKRFQDVLLADSTVIRLHRWLRKEYPGSRTTHSPAAAKLYLVMGVKAKGPSTVKIKPQKTHDRRLLQIGPWVRGRLLLLDLGFYHFALFANIVRYQGFFLSRLKENANPRIVEVVSQHRGRAIDLVGKRLSEVRGRLKRKTLDVLVEVKFQRRAYAGWRSWDRLTVRMVGVLNLETNRYHFYLTNLPTEEWSAEEVAKLYGLRWEIELVFRELKGSYRMDQIPSRKKEVVEALIYASLLTLFVSRQLLQAVREKLREPIETTPEERWSRLFRAISLEILVIVLDKPQHARCMARRVEPFLLTECRDPNRNRALLLERSVRRAA